MSERRLEKLMRFRWLVVAAWLAAAALLVIFTPPANPVANEMTSFLPDWAPSVQAGRLLAKEFPRSSGLNQAVIVVERSTPAPTPTDTPAPPATSPEQDSLRLTMEDLAALDAIVATLRQPLPPELARDLGVQTLMVTSPGDFPIHPNPLRSPDGQAAIAFASIPANFITIRSDRATHYIRHVVASASAQPDWPAGLKVAVTGSAAYGSDYAAATNNSHRKTLWVTVLAVLAILLVVYRAPLAAVAVLVMISLAALVASHLLTAGSVVGIHMGTAERIFVFVLLYGVGVDYSLLYLSRYREFLLTMPDPIKAAAKAWVATAPAIAASSGTNIAGLAMLSFAQYRIFHTTGMVLPIALTVALLAALTLVPAGAAILHRKLFWPAWGMAGGPGRFWPAVGKLVTVRPLLVLLATLAVLAWPAWHGSRLHYVYDTLTGLSPNYGAVQGTEMARRHWPIGEITPTTVLLTAEGAEARRQLESVSAQFTTGLDNFPGVADVRSLSQPLGKQGLRAGSRALLKLAADRIRPEYVSPDSSAVQLTVVLNDPGFSLSAMDTLARIHDQLLARLPAGVKAAVGGATAEMADTRAVTSRDFKHVAVLVLVVVFVVVLILIRDPILSAFMVASTALSYLSTLGITQAFFVLVMGQAGLDWKVQVFLFVVLVAVGEDYNIFLAARLAEEGRRLPPHQAAFAAVVSTGRIISSAGLIMAATLGSLLVGEITLLVQLGFAFAVGMLLDTFIVRPLLLPAFAVLTGRTGKSLTKAAGHAKPQK